MTILIINDNFKVIGGAERYFYNLVKLLKDWGHDVFTLTFDNREYFQNNDFVLKQYSGRIGQFFAHRFISFRYFKIRKIINRIQPDIIHFHNIHENRYTILWAGRGYKIVQTVHDLNFIFPDYLKTLGNHKNIFLLKSRIFWHRLIKSLFIDEFIAPSDFIKNEMIKYGYKNVSKLPYFWKPTPPSHINANRQSIVLYSGRLTKEKGVEYLVEIFKILAVDKNIKLIAAGEGPEKFLLEELAENNSQIRMTGWLTADELEKLYATASVLVVTSVIPENSPLVIYEALANGLPVIAFNVGGINELIKDGFNGFLVAAGNVREMTEKIIRLLKDKETAEKIYLNIKNSLNQPDNPYDSDFHYQQLTNIYAKARNRLPADR